MSLKLGTTENGNSYLYYELYVNFKDEKMTGLQKNKWYKLSEHSPPFTTGEHIPLLIGAKDEGGYVYKSSSAHQCGLKGLDDKGEPIYSGFEFSGWDKHFQRSFGQPTHFMIIGSPEE